MTIFDIDPEKFVAVIEKHCGYMMSRIVVWITVLGVLSFGFWAIWQFQFGAILKGVKDLLVENKVSISLEDIIKPAVIFGLIAISYVLGSHWWLGRKYRAQNVPTKSVILTETQTDHSATGEQIQFASRGAQLSRTDGLSWLHLRVETTEKFGPRQFRASILFHVPIPVNGRWIVPEPISLRWQSSSVRNGGEFDTRLEIGYPRFIPLFCRHLSNTQENFWLWGNGDVRLTDHNTLWHKQPSISIPPGGYLFSVRIESDGDAWESRRYILGVPSLDSDHSWFWFVDVNKEQPTAP